MKYSLLNIFLFLQISTFCQSPLKAQMTDEAWEITAKSHEFAAYKGKKALYLNNGNAVLKNSDFKNGIIDYNVAFSKGRKFVGINFRLQNTTNYEVFYFRPHQSGNPDATQYTPEINGNAGWQLYAGEGYSKAVEHKFDTWMHVRLIISDNKADVFIDDMNTPFMHIHDLKIEQQSGKIGFGVFMGDAYYANLTYQNIEDPKLVSEVTALPQPEAGTITSWQVSPAFSVKEITNLTNISTVLKATTNWRQAEAEYNGLLNLSQFSPVSENTNTIFVKKVITSKSEQIKALNIAFSDAATVYLNGNVLYHGEDRFLSRDYRFLGTIGYFDTVYLPLKKGKNELTIAVSEAMGGWGIKAKFADMSGIKIK